MARHGTERVCPCFTLLLYRTFASSADTFSSQKYCELIVAEVRHKHHPLSACPCFRRARMPEGNGSLYRFVVPAGHRKAAPSSCETLHTVDPLSLLRCAPQVQLDRRVGARASASKQAALTP